MDIKEIDERIANEIEAIIEPATDIANAAFALVIERSADLDMSPLVCIMMLRQLCGMNARGLIDRKQKELDSFVDKIPGLKEHLHKDADMYLVLKETIRKLASGSLKYAEIK